LPLVFEQPLEDMHHERHPSRRSFKETELQFWILFGNLVTDQIAERQYRLNPAMAEGVIALDVEQLDKFWAARAGVNTDRQIGIVGRLIDWMEVRIVEGALSLDATEEHAHRAV